MSDPTPPNILFVLADQMRRDEVTPRTMPNLTRLARRGIAFTNAYCAATLCQPSRNSIVTGRYPTQHGVCGNMNEPIGAAARADTYPRRLQAAGYHTAMIGKHHYIDRFNVGMDVRTDTEALREYGYDDVWQALDINEHCHNDSDYTQWLVDQGLLDTYREEYGQTMYEALAPDATVDGRILAQAKAYLEAYDQQKPLLLAVGVVGPHPPYWAPAPYREMFRPDDMPAPKQATGPGAIRAWQRKRARKAGMVRLIDDGLGRLLDVLDAKGMSDNTLIVFTADHGDMMGDHGEGDKRFFYEESVGVPLVMAGAGVPVDEREPLGPCRALVSGVDLYQTFLHAAGARSAHDDAGRVGLSLLDVAADRCVLRDAVVSELGTSTMIRDANWKLVYDPEEGGVIQLFNLRTDPQELRNLAGEPGHGDVEARLVSRLLDHSVRQSRFTHTKERKRVQRVRV